MTKVLVIALSFMLGGLVACTGGKDDTAVTADSAE